MAGRSTTKAAAGDVAYVVGIVVLVLAVGFTASQTGYFYPGSYTPSECAPNGSGGCTFYVPSSYTPATYSPASTGGAAILAIILSFVAYYYGKRVGKLASEPTLIGDVGPKSP